MQQNIDVSPRDPQGFGDVLAALLFEQPQRHDGALGVAEARDAGSKAQVFFGLGKQGLERRRAEVFFSIRGERHVRAGSVVVTSPVPGQILDDPPEIAGVLCGVRGEFVPERELEEGAAGFMKAIKRGLGVEPLQASEFGQAESLRPQELVERVDGIGVRRSHSA